MNKRKRMFPGDPEQTDAEFSQALKDKREAERNARNQQATESVIPERKIPRNLAGAAERYLHREITKDIFE